MASEHILRIYHGSSDPNLVPTFSGGKEYHDYGKGFYCVEDIEMAKEWACQHNDKTISYVYAFNLNLLGLDQIMNLNTSAPAYWLSALAAHRYISKEGALLKQRRERFIKAFHVDCTTVDVVMGWRANDQYFAYLRDFLRMDISYEAVVEAMRLGDLGQQVVLISEKAYANCLLVDKIAINESEYDKYYKQYNERDLTARSAMNRARDLPGRSIEDLILKGDVYDK